MFFTYKNCKLLINDNPIYAQRVDITWQGKPEPAYNINNKNSLYYLPSDGINGSINFSYYITGQDFIINNIVNETDPLRLQFGNLYINSGYLKRYSFSAVPNNPVIINAEISFFDNLTGTFTPNFESIDNLAYLNIGDAQISSIKGGNTIGQISNITSLNYSYDVEIKTQYNAGNTIPNRVAFGPKNVSLDLSSDKVDGYINITGNKVALRTKLIHPIDTGIFQSFDCVGVLYQKNLSTSINSLLNSTYFIKQNDLSSFNSINSVSLISPIIYFVSPNSGYFGASIDISGKNLSYVTDIAYTENIFDKNFQIVNDNQIISTIPVGTSSGPITLYSDKGSAVSTQIIKIGGIPISINYINPITGNVGDNISISGQNFYEIDKVIFGNNQYSNFNRINANLISAIVPHNTAWGKLRAVSTYFNLSGISTNEFVPIPDIFGFYPGSGLSGEYITISGEGFSGVTGVKINNLPTGNTDVFTITNNTGISVQIPSGNTKGIIKLYGQSGVTSISNNEFYPYVKITGLIPTSGHTGDLISISGQNFIPEILYSFGSNLFAVGFEGNVTGYFQRTNNILLSGSVPSGAKSGIIHVYSQTQEQYPSNFVFNVRHNTPIINYINPNSGKYQDNISIIGTDFYDISSIIITGAGTGSNLTTSNFSVSSTNDYINFNIPNITGGIYSIIINAQEGSFSGNNLFTLLDKPIYSGYKPISGGAGLLVSLSGKNIYANITKVFVDNTGLQCSINSGSFSNDNFVSFYMPPNLSSGNHKIILNNSVDYITGSPDFNYVPAPIISDFYPLSGQYNDRILVSGQFFDSVYSTKITQSGVNFSVVGTTGLYFNIPNVSNGYIKLENTGGVTLSDQRLIIVPPLPIFSGFIPNPTYYLSGTIISGLYLDTVKEIRFSGITGGESILTNFSGINTTGISFILPNNISGGGFMKIVNDRGYSYSPNVISFIPNAVLSLINLNTGAFKDNLFFSGSGLSGTLPYFDSPFGNLIIGDNINRISDSGLFFSVPSGIVSSQIKVKSRNQNIVSFTGNFTVLPTISGISGIQSYPTGTYMTFTGINSFNINNFLGISGNNNNYYNLVTSGLLTGINKTGYSIIITKINNNFAGTGKLFLSPIEDTGIYNQISNSLSYGNLNKLLFTSPTTISQPAPIITSFTPTGASPSGLLTINGQNLFSTTNVYFQVGSDVGTGTISISGENQIKIIPPIMTTGTGIIYLATNFGSTSTGLFRVLSPLIISGYTPTVCHTGDLIRISGLSFLLVTGVNMGGINASFTKTAELGTIIITGTVPSSGVGCCSSDVLICVSDEGESFCL